MPSGTPVDRCFQKLRKEKGDASAARICQSATGTSLKTGEAPKKKKSFHLPSVKQSSLLWTKAVEDEGEYTPPENPIPEPSPTIPPNLPPKKPADESSRSKLEPTVLKEREPIEEEEEPELEGWEPSDFTSTPEMRDEEGFRQAITENPDRTNLLVYGDWLEERGNPLAQAIKDVLEIDEAKISRYDLEMYGGFKGVLNDILDSLKKVSGGLQGYSLVRWLENTPLKSWMESHPKVKKRIIASLPVRGVVFMQGEDANEAIQILDEYGEDAAIQYLTQWDEGEGSLGTVPGGGDNDIVYERDDGYILTYNSHLGYIGLERREEADADDDYYAGYMGKTLKSLRMKYRRKAIDPARPDEEPNQPPVPNPPEIQEPEQEEQLNQPDLSNETESPEIQEPEDQYADSLDEIGYSQESPKEEDKIEREELPEEELPEEPPDGPPEEPAPVKDKPYHLDIRSSGFQPEWTVEDPVIREGLEAYWDSPPNDVSNLYMVADLLEEQGDNRSGQLRDFLGLWEQSQNLQPAEQEADHDFLNYAFSQAKTDPIIYRKSKIFGVLVAFFTPAGDGSDRRMWETWGEGVDKSIGESILAVQKYLLMEGSAGLAAGSQAYAAWSQADAVGSQAYAAWSQADAVRRQAYAVRSQAYAAWSQADAAWSQADAAWSQAYAAGSQAYAVGSQADAAGRQARKFARAVFDLVMSPPSSQKSLKSLRLKYRKAITPPDPEDPNQPEFPDSSSPDLSNRQSAPEASSSPPEPPDEPDGPEPPELPQNESEGQPETQEGVFRTDKEREQHDIRKSVLENPKDSNYAAIYADWLEENGNQEGSALIRGVLSLENAQGKDAEVLLDNLEQVLGVRGFDLAEILRIYVGSKWLKEHPKVERMILSRPGVITEEFLDDVLPHGSGIDSSWGFEETDDSWIATNSYHAMNDVGYYIGYIGFTVTIPKDDPLNFEIDVEPFVEEQENENYDPSWNEEDGEQEEPQFIDVDYSEGLDEYLGDSISAALSDYFRHPQGSPEGYFRGEQ